MPGYDLRVCLGPALPEDPGPRKGAGGQRSVSGPLTAFQAGCPDIAKTAVEGMDPIRASLFRDNCLLYHAGIFAYNTPSCCVVQPQGRNQGGLFSGSIREVLGLY